MNFELTEEQTLIRDSVRRFVEDTCPFDKRRAVVESDAGYSDEHWQGFAELGLLGASVPEDVGGLGGSGIETMLVMEQFGRGLVVSPYVASVVLGAGLVRETGGDAARQEILPAIVGGGMKLAVAYAERAARHAVDRMMTRARKADGGYILDGEKIGVLYAEAADRLIVAAVDETADEPGAVSLFVVSADAPGLTMRHYRTHDGGRASEIVLDGVAVERPALLGEPGGGRLALERVLDEAAAAVCAEAVGAMWAVYEQTLEYLKTRKQFGQPLGSFQALQHRMVDVYMYCELAQSMVYEAALALDCADPGERARRISGAKAVVDRYARIVGYEGIQLHGAIGVTDDVPVGHYLKRIVAIGQSFGDRACHLERYRVLSA